MLIATENEDQQQVWYIFGRICFYLFDVEPIEDAGYEFGGENEHKNANLQDILNLVDKINVIQHKIDSGEFAIAD